MTRPGRWMRARHLTMPGWLFEVRLRADGDYDTRVVGDDEPCERGISRAYVEAEYYTLPPYPPLKDTRRRAPPAPKEDPLRRCCATARAQSQAAAEMRDSYARRCEELRANVESRRLRARDAVGILRDACKLRTGCCMVDDAAKDAAARITELEAELAGARVEHAALAIAAEAYLERIGNDEVGYMPAVFNRLGRGHDE